MIIDIHNPNGTILRDIECEWEVEWPRIEDRLDPATMKLTVNRKKVPIRQFAKVVAMDGKNVVFMGYAANDSYDSDTSDWECIGAEAGLEGRWTPRYYWPSNTKLQDVLTHSITDGGEASLLGIANGGIPHGTTHTVYSANANVIKLDGRGSASHFGICDLYTCGLSGLRKLSPITGLDQLTAADYAFYRDATDVYIRISGGYDRGWIKNGGLIAENAYDTRCRFLSISDPTLVMDTDLDVSNEEIGSLMVSLAQSYGLYTHIRYSEDFAYFYFDENMGST